MPLCCASVPPCRRRTSVPQRADVLPYLRAAAPPRAAATPYHRRRVTRPSHLSANLSPFNRPCCRVPKCRHRANASPCLSVPPYSRDALLPCRRTAVPPYRLIAVPRLRSLRPQLPLLLPYELPGRPQLALALSSPRRECAACKEVACEQLFAAVLHPNYEFEWDVVPVIVLPVASGQSSTR